MTSAPEGSPKTHPQPQLGAMPSSVRQDSYLFTQLLLSLSPCSQFWSCYVSCSAQYSDAVRVTMDQFDTIRRFVDKYSDDFVFVTKASGESKAACT